MLFFSDFLFFLFVRYCCNDNFTLWKEILANSSPIPGNKLSVGLMADGDPYMNATQVLERLQVLSQQGLDNLAFWKLPLPDAYWDALAQWDGANLTRKDRK